MTNTPICDNIVFNTTYGSEREAGDTDKRKIIYYSDELNDEFSKAQITPIRIDGKYVYCHDRAVEKLASFFWYRIIFTPIAYSYSKLCFGHKTVGKSKLSKCKGKGYFLYGNHTQDIGDAFLPNLLNFPKRDYFIVHPNKSFCF